jgi:hypothetical protein
MFSEVIFISVKLTIPFIVVGLLTLIGRCFFLKTNLTSLEEFKLFYEELKPIKKTTSRIRRVRMATATK